MLNKTFKTVTTKPFAPQRMVDDQGRQGKQKQRFWFKYLRFSCADYPFKVYGNRYHTGLFKIFIEGRHGALGVWRFKRLFLLEFL
jgi:hypothetical protein